MAKKSVKVDEDLIRGYMAGGNLIMFLRMKLLYRRF